MGIETMTSLGIQENHEAVLAYLFGFVSGIILLILEKDSPFVKFHAIQSIIVSGIIFILSTILTISIIGALLVPFIGLAGLVIWILCMIKAYKGETYKLPVIGDLAEKYI